MDQIIGKYKKAECFLPWNLHTSIYNSTIFPYWTDEALYYFQQSSAGKKLMRIDFNSAKKEIIMNFDVIVKTLSSHQGEEIDPEQISIDKFSVRENPRRIYFFHLKNNWCYDIEKNTCFKENEIEPYLLKSPDKNWALKTENYNLFLSDLKSQTKHQVTYDGEAYYDYASSPETNTRAITNRLEKNTPEIVAIWSSDSKKIVTHKLDQRNVKSLSLLQNAPDDSQRPIVHSYHMSFSGDTELPLASLFVLDVDKKNIIPISAEPLLSPYLTPIEFKWVWWSKNSKKIYFLRETRGSKELMLCVSCVESGHTEILITETAANTYVEPSQLFMWPHQIIILEERNEIIWMSERSGYSHLYLYEMGNNISKHVITQGDWCVREVHFHDEVSDWLYFTACGYDKSIDPYFKQLFRCRSDGSNLECLTAENANHTIYLSPSKKYFLDTYSTIDSAPISVLKTIEGKQICLVESANIDGLTKLNWTPPERVCIKGRDGTTSIYGNLYYPSDFNPKKKYPLIDHIYPGPQVYRTSPHFSLYGLIFRSAWTAQALAELGFIVLHIDGFGTPGRSKAFHDATYKNMSDCGIPDHVAAIKQLAEKNSFIDINNIGITGYSGGGLCSNSRYANVSRVL